MAGYIFDLKAELPFRVFLLMLGPADSVLLMLMHHIISDGWSMAPLIRDLSAAYSARCQGAAPGWEALPVQYADYVLWQRELLGSEADPGSLVSRDLKFWRRELAGMPIELPLPMDRPRSATGPRRGGAASFEADQGVYLALAELARASQVTLFMVLQAGLAALLTRLGAGEDIPFGAPLAGRVDEALDDLVGFFVNTIVLRTDTSGDPSFRDLLVRVRTADLAAFEHQDMPFERLVEMLNPPRSPSMHPLFQVMIALQSHAKAALSLPAIMAMPVADRSIPSQFDLLIDVDLRIVLTARTELDGDPAGLDGLVEYRADLFDHGTAVLLAEGFVRLLKVMAADPNLRLSQVEVVPVAGRGQLRPAEASVSAAPQMVAAPATAPPTARETLLRRIFAEVLAVPEVGLHDNFFELGGHSLLAASLARRLRDDLRTEAVSAGMLFRYPTVAQLAKALDVSDT
jgi:hypothetical protein